jgi:hypothetical protein
MAIFFAPDTMVYGVSTPILDALEQGVSVVLTPHFTTPPAPTSGSIRELDALRMGSFNLGFMAARRSEATARLLDWWGRFLQFKGLRRPEAGLFLDGKPLDLAAGYFEDVHIYRSAGANVGIWNLADRPLTRTGTSLFAGGAPLEFLRFDDWEQEGTARSANGRDGVFAELAAHYARLLDEHRHARYGKLPYSYDVFLSGRRIPDALRKLAKDRILFLGTSPFASDRPGSSLSN